MKRRAGTQSWPAVERVRSGSPGYGRHLSPAARRGPPAHGSAVMTVEYFDGPPAGWFVLEVMRENQRGWAGPR
jgi:hypothetical protein